VFITKSGQALITSIKRGKQSLEDFVIETGSEQDLGSSWTILSSRLDNHSPITPGSAFGISNKGLVAVVSTLLTYMIVLIQFKLSGS